jgi:hypothetical protein
LLSFFVRLQIRHAWLWLNGLGHGETALGGRNRESRTHGRHNLKAIVGLPQSNDD